MDSLRYRVSEHANGLGDTRKLLEPRATKVQPLRETLKLIRQSAQVIGRLNNLVLLSSFCGYESEHAEQNLLSLSFLSAGRRGSRATRRRLARPTTLLLMKWSASGYSRQRQRTSLSLSPSPSLSVTLSRSLSPSRGLRGLSAANQQHSKPSKPYKNTTFSPKPTNSRTVRYSALRKNAKNKAVMEELKTREALVVPCRRSSFEGLAQLGSWVGVEESGE